MTEAHIPLDHTPFTPQEQAQTLIDLWSEPGLGESLLDSPEAVGGFRTYVLASMLGQEKSSEGRFELASKLIDDLTSDEYDSYQPLIQELEGYVGGDTELLYSHDLSDEERQQAFRSRHQKAITDAVTWLEQVPSYEEKRTCMALICYASAMSPEVAPRGEDVMGFVEAAQPSDS